jgi:uncharacterized repeat protein (TIGR01451 family)
VIKEMSSYHLSSAGKRTVAILVILVIAGIARAVGAAPSVTTNAATNITSSGGQLNGAVNPNGASTSAYFEYGTTTSYGSQSGPITLSGTSPIGIQATLSSAPPNTTYHYRVVASNSGGPAQGNDASFTTLPASQSPPSATTNAATNITSSGGQLNGTVNPNGASTSAYFEYGTTTSYGSQSGPTTLSGTSPIGIQATLSSAPPNTTYHYRVVASNSGGPVQGNDASFTTLPASQSLPSVTTNAATNITSSGGQLNGTVNPNGASTSAYFEYGTTTSYGSQSGPTTLSGTSPIGIQATLSSAPPNTTYHYRVVASNSGGPVQGNDASFTTQSGGNSTPTPTPTPPNPSLNITSILPSGTQQRDWGQTISYTVSVQDLQGRPVQAASVMINDDLKSQSISAPATDINGKTTYQTSVPVGKSDGTYQMSFQAFSPGYTTSSAMNRQVQVQHVTATPTVQIISPAGGENWQIGTMQTLSATLTGSVTAVHFAYSAPGTSTWTTINAKPAIPSGNMAAINWPIAQTVASGYRIQVTVDYNGGSISAESAQFNITDPPPSQTCNLRSVPKDFQTCYDMWKLGIRQAQESPRAICSNGGCIFGPTYHGYNEDGESIADSGCFLVSLSMVLRAYNFDFDPSQLNDTFVDAGAFTSSTHEINNTSGAKSGIAAATANVLSFSDDGCPYVSDGEEAFEKFLSSMICNQTPVIVQIGSGDSSHYVVVVGQDEVGFIVNDPGRCPEIVAGKTLHLYKSPQEPNDTKPPFRARGYLVRVNHPANRALKHNSVASSQGLSTVHISVNSVADLMVTDQNGSRTGIDRDASAELHEIPSSGYFVDSNGNDSIEDVSARISSVDLNAPESGIYNIAVLGRLAGPYTVEIHQFDDNGTLTKTSFINGISSVGSLDNYYLVLGGSANLSITSSVSAMSARVGDNVTYTLTVTNSGSSDASAVTLTDTLPPGVSFNSVDGGQYTYDPATRLVTITLDSMSAGATATVILHVEVTAPGTLTNSASVSSVESDTDTSDNTTTVPVIASALPPSVRLANISTRVSVGTGDNAMIGGFIITGTQAKTVLVRGIGPSLAAFGVPGPLADPIIEVHGSAGELLAPNDNWRDDEPDRVQHVIDSGLAPTNDLESAKWGQLNPGNYTVVVRGKGDSAGVGVFEVYDLDQTVDSKLANISTRGFVDTGDNAMIGGTIITGSTPATVLFRAIGPSLTNAGVANALQDPTLELHDGNGTVLDSNDNWQDSANRQAIINTTIPPTDDRESAILESLPPGAYTAIVRGSGNSTGVAVVEAYQLQ